MVKAGSLKKNKTKRKCFFTQHIMKLCYSSTQDAEETWRINWSKINKIIGLGSFIRRGPLVIINEVGGTSRSGNPGAIDFRKWDTVTRKGSCFPGPIFPLDFCHWGEPEAATRRRDLRLKQSSPSAGNSPKLGAWCSPAETHGALLWEGACHLHGGQNRRSYLRIWHTSAASLCSLQSLSGHSKLVVLGE